MSCHLRSYMYSTTNAYVEPSTVLASSTTAPILPAALEPAVGLFSTVAFTSPTDRAKRIQNRPHYTSFHIVHIHPAPPCSSALYVFITNTALFSTTFLYCCCWAAKLAGLLTIRMTESPRRNILLM
mmetsp:Transcript_1713/g.2836  ORF Transcript_1713/g.2836 Transcript_1713/m.2836 type:complete len:126 (-) Transcript_1713:247-624(-)